MENRKILLVGGGGHCRSVLDSVLALREYDGAGVVAKDEEDREKLGGQVPVVGIDADLPRLRGEGWKFAFVALGSVGDAAPRRRIFEMLKSCGFSIPALVDPTAAVSASASLGEGVFVGKRAVINFGARIGLGAIINTGAIVEHDCAVGAYAHVSPGAVLCGQVTVGGGAHIGAGSVVRQGLRVGENALVGIGSVVVKDLPPGVRAFGNPCTP